MTASHRTGHDPADFQHAQRKPELQERPRRLKSEAARIDNALEGVLGRELQMPLHRANALQRNIAKVGIANASVRIAVADDVECVEGVKAEAHGVVFKKVEVFEGGHIHVEVARTADRPIFGGTECVVGGHTECARVAIRIYLASSGRAWHY